MSIDELNKALLERLPVQHKRTLKKYQISSITRVQNITVVLYFKENKNKTKAMELYDFIKLHNLSAS